MGLLVRALGERRGNPLENPNLPLNDPDVWEQVFGESFGKSASGEKVTLNTSLRISGIWRGVNLIANKCGGTPLFVLKRGDGVNDQTRDEQHNAAWLVGQSTVHPDAGSAAAHGTALDAFQFKKLLTFHAIMRGNGYAYIVRDGAGRPLMLKALDPSRTYLARVDLSLIHI